MNVLQIKDILSNKHYDYSVSILSFVRNKRTSKNCGFLSVNDGSCIHNLQVVVDFDVYNKNEFNNICIGSSVEIVGTVKKSLGSEQNVELLAENVTVLSQAVDYPLQPKNHSYDFLRSIAHLRMRTTLFSSVFRVRNAISFSIHKFFQERGFIYINTPLITGNDCEGAGEMFSVVTREGDNYDKICSDFFGHHVGLTVSGQLEAETAIFGLGKVYTFGPTFRAENSNTTRHLSEFWMVEPEVAFMKQKGIIALAEEMLKYIIKSVLNDCEEEMAFLDKRYRKDYNESLIEKLNNVLSHDFIIITYSEAVDILKHSNKDFKYAITEWGCDLQSEHERFIVEEHFNNIPVAIVDYPEKIKAFYMRLNDDKRTVAAVDVLFPGIGEIVGGSQREERIDYLLAAMERKRINSENISWYLDTRIFGSIPHSGFGLGVERLVQFITGMGNIRDVVLFPRYPKHAEF